MCRYAALVQGSGDACNGTDPRQAGWALSPETNSIRFTRTDDGEAVSARVFVLTHGSFTAVPNHPVTTQHHLTCVTIDMGRITLQVVAVQVVAVPPCAWTVCGPGT